MVPRMRGGLPLVFLAVALVAMVSALTVPAVAHEPITKSTESHKLLVSQFEKAIGRFSKRDAIKARSSSKAFVISLLNAGQCDKAHKLMLDAIKSGNFSSYCFVDHYCFAMALADRADEIPSKVEPFRNTLGVKNRLKDEEVDFETLCKVPILHGTAIGHAISGDVATAVEEIEKIRATKSFKYIIDDIESSVGYEVFYSAGAKACVDFLERISAGKERYFQSLIRTLVRHLNISDDSNQLLFELPVDHPKTFLKEFNFVATEPVRSNHKQAKVLIDFAISKLPELDEETANELKATLSNSSLVEAEQRDQFGLECLEWLESNPEGDRRAMMRVLAPWLASAGKLEKLKPIALAYGAKSKFKQATLASGVLKALPDPSGEEVRQIAGCLPDPSELGSEKRYKSDVFELLVRSFELELASKWLASIDDEKTNEICSNELKLHQLVDSLKGQPADELAQEVVEQVTKMGGLKRFKLYLRNRLLAGIAQVHGLEAMIATARKLSDAGLLRSSAIKACIQALFGRGRIKEVMELADLATAQERATERLEANGSHDVIPFLKLNTEHVDWFAEQFPSSVFVLRDQATRAIGDGDRDKALKIHEKLVSKFDDNTLQYQFVQAGWEVEYFGALKRGLKKSGKTEHERRKELRISVLDVADWIMRQRDTEEAVGFIKQFAPPTASERIWIYNSLSPSLINPSHLVWNH